MAIDGKTWSACLVRGVTQSNGAYTERQVLYYSETKTTPAEIAGYYPTLSWDATGAIGPSMNYLRSRYLPWNDPPFVAYDSDEDAMLDSAKFAQSGHLSSLTYLPIGGAHYLRWQNGAWRYDGIYSGSSDDLWDMYPLSPLTAETTPTPFGAYGNGLIKYQYLFTNGPDFTPIPNPPTDWEINNDQEFTVGIVDITYIFTPTEDGEPGEDGVGDGLTDDSVTIRVWGFSLDGHDFYVLRLGQGETLVYDLTTGTWSSWKSPGRDNWRVHVGMNWPGMSSEFVPPINLHTSDVLCGDDCSNSIFTLAPEEGRDERYTTGDDLFTRQVTAGVRASGREVINCGAVTLDAVVGNPTQTDAYFTLEISDDLGETWTNCGSVIVEAGTYDAVVEWRGLGQIKQPGRLFRITDNGASYSIGALDLR